MHKYPISHQGLTGLTVIELMVAIAIIAVATTIALPSYSNYVERTKVSRAIDDIGAINAKLRLYMVDNAVPPPSLAAVGESGKKDPWGNSYQYTNLTTAGIGKARKNKNLVPINSDFDLWSNGKDGITKLPLTAKASQDDVILANDGRYIGLASNYE